VGGIWEVTGRGKDRFTIRDLLADDRCSQAVLRLLSTTDIGRLVPDPAEEEAQSEASEWELRERREREEESRQEAEMLGAGCWVLGAEEEEGRPLSLPPPSFMASAAEEQGVWRLFL
jgi:hypothetical protein